METRFLDEQYTRWLILPRRRFICDLTVTDATSFSMIFSTATTRLKEWHDKNQRSASEFELRLSAPPVVLERAQVAMDSLYASNASYNFVKKLKLTIVFQNIENGVITRHICQKP